MGKLGFLPKQSGCRTQCLNHHKNPQPAGCYKPFLPLISQRNGSPREGSFEVTQLVNGKVGSESRFPVCEISHERDCLGLSHQARLHINIINNDAFNIKRKGQPWPSGSMVGATKGCGVDSEIQVTRHICLPSRRAYGRQLSHLSLSPSPSKINKKIIRSLLEINN